MLRGIAIYTVFTVLLFHGWKSHGEIHSGYTQPIPSLPGSSTLTPGGRYYGVGATGYSTVSGFPNTSIPSLSTFPVSNYQYSPTSYPSYSFGYWGNLFGNWGLCYKQPGLYNNYQYGPYNYGSSQNDWANYYLNPGSCYGYGLGLAYNPCKSRYGFWGSKHHLQPRLLSVTF